MKLQIKRAYDTYDKSDGLRVLVDRLWLRGVTKAKAKIDLWAKEVAPTSELRRWFHADPEKRYKSFSQKYATELKNNPIAKSLRSDLKKTKGPVTLITASRNIETSHLPTLTEYLKK
jgi:uncharacterized protein YeaO (DUF488 family)